MREIDGAGPCGAGREDEPGQDQGEGSHRDGLNHGPRTSMIPDRLRVLATAGHVLETSERPADGCAFRNNLATVGRRRAWRGHPAVPESRLVTNNEAPRQQMPDTTADVDPDVAQLLGLRPTDAPDLPGESEVDSRGAPSDTAVYEGEPPGDGEASRDVGALQLEPLAPNELRGGETDTPDEAAEEGLTWIPPTDPPIVAGAF